MKLPATQLTSHLQGDLKPVYIVTGDEPLLCQEAADSIRQACRQRGHNERQIFNVETGFDWGLLLQAGASLSLFAEKRLIELRMPSAKPGDKGTAALLEYLARPAEDSVLLLTLPRLDGSVQKSKWCKALIDSPHSVFIQIWPIDNTQLPNWIRQRLSQAGLSATPEVIDMLAARVEGNLLAAAQEIEKLKLLVDTAQLDAETVQTVVADSARFDIFGLTDTTLNGEAVHALRMLQGLRGEGVETTVILWALARELRQLAEIAQQLGRGIPRDRAMANARPPIWEKRRPLFSRALQRHPVSFWGQMLMLAQRADAQIKGQSAGDPWNTLAQLIAAIAGQRLPLAECD